MVKVHAQLRDAILDGELAQGAILSQVQLAEQFGVSRTPLREALRMLQAEGLIDSVPNRRVRVASFSIEDLNQLYMMRIGLESLAVRVSVPHFDEDDFGRLHEYITQMRTHAKSKDASAWNVPHRAFHCALAAHAGERVEGMVGQLMDSADRYRRLLLDLAHDEVWRRAEAEHDAIMAACERRDARAASALLGEHLAETALTLGTLMGSEDDPVPVRLAVSLFSGSSVAAE